MGKSNGHGDRAARHGSKVSSSVGFLLLDFRIMWHYLVNNLFFICLESSPCQRPQARVPYVCSRPYSPVTSFTHSEGFKQGELSVISNVRRFCYLFTWVAPLHLCRTIERELLSEDSSLRNHVWNRYKILRFVKYKHLIKICLLVLLLCRNL